MKTYRVIDPKGVYNGDKLIEKGGTIVSPSATSQIKAWLRFRQVEEIPAAANEDKPVQKASTEPAKEPEPPKEPQKSEAPKEPKDKPEQKTSK